MTEMIKLSKSQVEKLMSIKQVAMHERALIEQKYNGNTMGKCIEATDTIVAQLTSMGIKAEAKQVWCLYELFESCSNYCYEEHWVVKATVGNIVRYIDVTMDQFQWAFRKKLPEIYTGNKLPNFYLTRKPGKGTLDKCGWNDWYNYGDYVNNFNYYK